MKTLLLWDSQWTAGILVTRRQNNVNMPGKLQYVICRGFTLFCGTINLFSRFLTIDLTFCINKNILEVIRIIKEMREIKGN